MDFSRRKLLKGLFGVAVAAVVPTGWLPKLSPEQLTVPMSWSKLAFKGAPFVYDEAATNSKIYFITKLMDNAFDAMDQQFEEALFNDSTNASAEGYRTRECDVRDGRWTPDPDYYANGRVEREPPSVAR